MSLFVEEKCINKIYLLGFFPFLIFSLFFYCVEIYFWKKKTKFLGQKNKSNFQLKIKDTLTNAVVYRTHKIRLIFCVRFSTCAKVFYICECDPKVQRCFRISKHQPLVFVCPAHTHKYKILKPTLNERPILCEHNSRSNDCWKSTKSKIEKLLFEEDNDS